MLYDLGVMLERMNKHDEARKCFEEGVQADGTNGRLLAKVAVVTHLVLGDKESAKQLYERAYDADPDNVENLVNYALFCDRVTNDQDRAEQVRAPKRRARVSLALDSRIAPAERSICCEAEPSADRVERRAPRSLAGSDR